MTIAERVAHLKPMRVDEDGHCHERETAMMSLSKSDRTATLAAMEPEFRALALRELEKLKLKKNEGDESKFDMDEMQKHTHESGLKK